MIYLFIPVGIGITAYNVKIYSGLRLMYEINESRTPSKDKIKEGAYKYKATITTVNGKTIEFEDKVCALGINAPTSYGNICPTCTYSDMIDPRYGFIFNTSENFCNQ